MFLFIVNILGAFVVDLLSIVCFVEDSLEVGNVEDFKVHVFKSSSELLEKLHEKWSKVGKKPYPAMYSSINGGIILDPALMVIPIDDHRIADENRTRLLVLLILKLDASDYQSLRMGPMIMRSILDRKSS
ncbi:hypothetical protein RchiOBHm_Chr2g0146631 [Rosa chinensis]|uniref:Uncharacterized protein n=1 Tax=Rosa chinensis TaxID=74649 RepID=A0A2P6RYX9_ROSCH|nr:hypothetical protein RchiOBHm_Chr2g0146631 [Rosa chinensis]